MRTETREVTVAEAAELEAEVLKTQMTECLNHWISHRHADHEGAIIYVPEKVFVLNRARYRCSKDGELLVMVHSAEPISGGGTLWRTTGSVKNRRGKFLGDMTATRRIFPTPSPN
jgi:hypothetical protein